MITITTQGKTYQIVDLKDRIKSTIEEWISAWYLEEVKENKEPQFYVWDIDISTGKPFKSGSTTQTFSTIKDQTILEKLREELDKMKTENTDTSDEYTQWVLNTCGYLLDLLTSLETKEEPTLESQWMVWCQSTEEQLKNSPMVWSMSQEEPQPQEDIELLPKWLQKVKNVYYWITEGGYWTGLVLEMEDGTFLRHQSTDIIRAFEFFNPQK